MAKENGDQFQFGDTPNNTTIGRNNHLPSVIRDVIKICKNLPANKLLFIQDICKRTNNSYAYLKGIASLTPFEYTAVGRVIVELDGKQILRLRRVFGNEKTIESFKQWQKTLMKTGV